MNIVYSSSPTMYPILKASIASLLEHNTPSKIYILAQEDTLPFEIQCDHKIINVSGQTYFPAGGPNMGRQNYFTVMSMMRVCVPDLIDEDKIIYLDCDTIICDSLLPLWETDITDKLIAWCPEHLGIWKPYGQKYYNAGVAVFNLKQMRADNVTQQLVEMLNTQPYRFVDQDVLNKIAIDRCVDIPVRYNESFCCGYTDNPAIVHYAGHGDLFAPKYFRREYIEKYL